MFGQCKPSISQQNRCSQIEYSENRLYINVNLTGVEKLNLEKAKEFPDSTFHLSVYRELDQNLDFSIFKNLEILEIADVQTLEKIPPSIFRLQNLKALILRDNKIKSISTEIEQLSKLEILNLRDNEIAELDIDFEKLKHLRDIDFSENRIRKLNKSLRELKGLQVLHVARNPLTISDIHEGLLPKIIELKITGNEFEEHNEKIKKLQNLIILDARISGLGKIPEQIYDLKKLDLLAIWGNKKEDYVFSTSIRNLDNLAKIMMHYSNSVSFPTQISECKKLKRIIIQYSENLNPNNIINPLQNNPNLSYLNLAACKLTSIPSNICNLRYLNQIVFNNNLISDVPECIGELSELETFEITDNSYVEIPKSIRNNQKIKIYK